MLPHLLVVGAGDSDDHGSCMRRSGKRGGRGGPISEDIGPPPPSHVPLTSLGLTGSDSDKLKEMEEEDCYLTGSWEALPHG